MTQPTDQDWAIRAAIYRYFVEHAQAPLFNEIASERGIELTEARDAFRRLHDAHALYLDPESDRIRMLNPFSAIETPYQVETGGRTYYANCAWDMLGIPAMLGQDALIHAPVEVANETVEIPVVNGQPRPDREYIINYSVPFAYWYDDLIHT